MSLTTDQVKMIKDYVMESRVSIPSLRDDLVDHLCCEIEGEMSEGKTFDKQLRKFYRKIARRTFTKSSKTQNFFYIQIK